jgi:hypothetical protein
MALPERANSDVKLGWKEQTQSVQKPAFSRVPGINKNLHDIILPVVLYGCETLSLTLREERRLRVFENIWA